MAQNPSGQSMAQHHRWSPLPCDILYKIIYLLNFPENTIFTISDSTFFIDLSSEHHPYNFSEFWNILDKLFTIFTIPSINTFRIHLHETLFEEPCIRPILNSWARRLRARNFQHIEIKSTRFLNGDKVFPPSLFQIHSLVSLNLDLFIFNEFDQFISHPIILPNLKKLELGVVDYGLQWLLRCCPSIEDLSFLIETTPTSNKSPISITCKNLKRLHISHFHPMTPDYIEFIIDAPRLEQFYFSGSFLSMRMFDLIPNVKSVQISGTSRTKLYDSTTKTIYPSWTHLTLELSPEIVKAIFEQQMLHCPNLETLKLNFFGFYLYEFNWDPEALFGLVEHVKRLELHMTDIKFNQQTLNLVTWLLRSAPVLEKLILFAYEGYSDDILSKAQFRQTLFECAENSSRCQIELSGAFKKLLQE